MASFAALAACRPPLLRFHSLRPSPARRFSFAIFNPRPPVPVPLLQLLRPSSSSNSCRQQRPDQEQQAAVFGSGTDSAPCGGGVEPQGKEAANKHEKGAPPAAGKLQAAARRQRQAAPKAPPAAPRGGRGGGRGGGRPTPPGNPREGRGKGGGVIHSVTSTTRSKRKPEPTAPGDPREGGGGNGGVRTIYTTINGD
ncbi:hypothetical protein E2562_000399 [Oryza meyeriana var. granulata]|uniref:Uncharacterized protein n=1 Tax=Oryza meyeriana var. granulata TaxID=110450 RepID=A0A6G1CC99_9ORYZ|nr:hypothetical protein E2562_000399 [Oryza meyeriana var. granulata]